MQKALLIGSVFVNLVFYATTSISLDIERADKQSKQPNNSAETKVPDQISKKIIYSLPFDYSSTDSGSTLSRNDLIEIENQSKNKNIFADYMLPKTDKTYGSDRLNSFMYDYNYNHLRSRHTGEIDEKGYESEFESHIKEINRQYRPYRR